MLRALFLTFVLFCPISSWAAYPYSSVAEILVEVGNGYNGGSATLVAVSKSHALLLTAQHVVVRKGKTVHIRWPETQEQLVGEVVRIGQGQDIALIMCPRPKNLYPVPVILPVIRESGPITNAGFPGSEGVLKWQQGEIISLSDTVLTYTCKPISGMSGGATFDKYGNLIGVITHYSLRGGGSASGVKMMEFLRRNYASTEWWEVGVESTEETPASALPDDFLFEAPDGFYDLDEYEINGFSLLPLKPRKFCFGEGQCKLPPSGAPLAPCSPFQGCNRGF